MPLLHLQREIDRLNKMILRLGGQVEENLRTGIECVQNRNSKLGMQLVLEDDVVDTMEVRAEEECLKALALNQPVATDLRYIIALLKINGELERIGDLAASMGHRAVVLARHELTTLPSQITVMGGLARDMLRNSLDALIQRDINACRRILKQDEQVNQLHREVYDWFKSEAQRFPALIDPLLNTYLAAKDLERIADHACSIAEDVVYLVSGEIIRHNGDILDDE
jgi:phosphate transport system protein